MSGYSLVMLLTLPAAIAVGFLAARYPNVEGMSREQLRRMQADIDRNMERCAIAAPLSVLILVLAMVLGGLFFG